jgi:hypothetical protein
MIQIKRIQIIHEQIEAFNSTIPIDLSLLISISLMSLSLHIDLLNISFVAGNIASLFDSILNGEETAGIRRFIDCRRGMDLTRAVHL